MKRLLCAILVVVTSCAVPRTHREFSLSRTGEVGEDREFASSTDLRVSGLVSEGLGFANIGRLYNAEGRLRQALYLEPSNDRIAFNLAVVINQADQSGEALTILNRLLAKEPRNPNYLQAVADVWVSEGDHETAKTKLKEAFSIFKGANNLPRAALLARSISNITFGIGNEQEALCYSYEALNLSPSPAQVSAHLRLLVALNLFQDAKGFFEAQKPLASEPLAFHAVAMATYALGDYKGALALEESAQSRLTQAPELTQEVNSAWWVMKQQVPDESEPSDEAKEKMLELQEASVVYAERAPYELNMWPAPLRRELVKATVQNNGQSNVQR